MCLLKKANSFGRNMIWTKAESTAQLLGFGLTKSGQFFLRSRKCIQCSRFIQGINNSQSARFTGKFISTLCLYITVAKCLFFKNFSSISRASSYIFDAVIKEKYSNLQLFYFTKMWKHYPNLVSSILHLSHLEKSIKCYSLKCTIPN